MPDGQNVCQRKQKQIPTLIGCLLFAGGAALLLPIALLSAALGLLKLGQ